MAALQRFAAYWHQGLRPSSAPMVTVAQPLSERRLSHWPDSSSAHPTQPRRRKRPVALKLLKPTKSGTLVLAAAGVWSSSRSSNPAASRDCGPFQQSASTAHDQHAPFAIPHHCTAATPTSHRQRPRSAHSNCQRRLPPPKRRSLSTASPFRLHPRCSKPRSRHSLCRLSRSKVKNQIKHRRQIPIA